MFIDDRDGPSSNRPGLLGEMMKPQLRNFGCKPQNLSEPVRILISPAASAGLKNNYKGAVEESGSCLGSSFLYTRHTGDMDSRPPPRRTARTVQAQPSGHAWLKQPRIHFGSVCRVFGIQ